MAVYKMSLRSQISIRIAQISLAGNNSQSINYNGSIQVGNEREPYYLTLSLHIESMKGWVYGTFDQSLYMKNSECRIFPICIIRDGVSLYWTQRIAFVLLVAY